MNLLFHIIFIPHSVNYLQYGVLSLLQFSNYRFCLVSNGLDTKEHQILKDLAGKHDRLTLYRKPGTRLLAHGDMVNILFKQCTEDWFCFMDNDIFATAPFDAKLESELKQCDVFSSAYTIGADPNQAGDGYMGLHLRTPGGLPLAVTHLCVYPRQKLADLIEETGVAFEHHAPSLSMPEIALQPGFPEDLTNVHKMDTGVLMNMLAAIRGWKFRFTDLPELVHIGSIAGYTKRQSKWSKRFRGFFTKRSESTPYRLTDKHMETELLKRLNRRHDKHGEAGFMSQKKERQYVETKILRNRIATYFICLFRSLLDNGPMPVIDISPGNLCERVTRASQVLEKVVKQ